MNQPSELIDQRRDLLYPATVPEMLSFKQFLLTALAYTALAQNEATPVTCSGLLDSQCCKDKGTAACSIELDGTVLSGNCVPKIEVSANS
jgi:hypothetical protein